MKSDDRCDPRGLPCTEAVCNNLPDYLCNEVSDYLCNEVSDIQNVIASCEEN